MYRADLARADFKNGARMALAEVLPEPPGSLKAATPAPTAAAALVLADSLLCRMTDSRSTPRRDSIKQVNLGHPMIIATPCNFPWRATREVAIRQVVCPPSETPDMNRRPSDQMHDARRSHSLQPNSSHPEANASLHELLRRSSSEQQVQPQKSPTQAPNGTEGTVARTLNDITLDPGKVNDCYAL